MRVEIIETIRDLGMKYEKYKAQARQLRRDAEILNAQAEVLETVGNELRDLRDQWAKKFPGDTDLIPPFIQPPDETPA